MNWKYVKPLRSSKLITDFEQTVNYHFPIGFILNVIENNGGHPEKCIFKTDTEHERILKTFLSFNKEHKESIWKINEWNKDELSDKYIAFAIDSFGNLICFDECNDSIVFINIKNTSFEYVANNFTEFLFGLQSI